MSSVQVGFIKWRIGVINQEIRAQMLKANAYHKRSNKTKLNETIDMIEKLKTERMSWFDKLAEAESGETKMNEG